MRSSLGTRFVSRDEMREIDRRAIQEFNIPALTLMENAGTAAGNLIEQLSQREGLKLSPVLCLCGTGNNGGDGLVVARLLHAKGYPVTVILAGDFDRISPECRTQMDRLRQVHIPVFRSCSGLSVLPAKLASSELVIDALFGIGLSRPITGIALEIIRAVNRSGKRVLSMDIPSGLDADHGIELPESIRATWTLTFGLPKLAFRNLDCASFLGEIFVDPIGFPESLLKS